MKSVLDKATRDELISRINSLSENSTAVWGKMDIRQMLKHSTEAEKLFMGKVKFKRSFIGRIFGKMALKGFLKDENPVKKNMPTLPEIKITKPVTCNVAEEKRNGLHW